MPRARGRQPAAGSTTLPAPGAATAWTSGGTPPGSAEVVTILPDGAPGPPVPLMRAHEAPGILHLAVSVALIDPDGRWLLQRRAASKRTFPTRWANACCTHPRPGELPADAAARRVSEELGLEVRDLAPAGIFSYRASDPGSGLVEHELDHVFVAVLDTSGAAPDPAEVGELARLRLADALALVASADGTPWAEEVLRLAARQRGEGPVALADPEDVGEQPRPDRPPQAAPAARPPSARGES